MINQHNSLIGFLVYDAQRAIAKSLETALKPYEITPGPVSYTHLDVYKRQERARSPIEVDGSDVYMQLRVARHGTVALSRRIDMTKPPISRSDVLFCDVNLQPLSVLTTASTGLGTWLDDGRWLDVGTVSYTHLDVYKRQPLATVQFRLLSLSSELFPPYLTTRSA